jgi:hypothetical protein
MHLFQRRALVFIVVAALAMATRTSHPSFAADLAAAARARDSIKATELKRHVEVLADDTFEGREAGSRGGRAAGAYLAREFERHKLKPAGGDGTYFQAFNGNCRNLLGVWEGSDARLKQEYVVVCAHYDHVGYGSRRNSNGPIGYIHNGADDNASGAAALLETVEALALLGQPLSRSVLFVLFDSEENGLNGSKHWVAQPTVPLARITTAINLDMIGRLRNERLTVYGTRTSQGLRRVVCEANRDCNLLIDFTWEMSSDSDHYTFFTAGVPVLMFHTGLHEDYHRPSDDTAKVNVDGEERVTRLLFNALLTLADEPAQRRFRPQSRQEFASMRDSKEVPLSPLPGRLGVRWKLESEAVAPGVVVESVVPNSAASRAGLRAGDRIVKFAGQAPSSDSFASLVLSAANPVEALVHRPQSAEPVTLKIQLSGQPIRFGLTWRIDDAEPTVAQVVRLVPGSPAATAGLRLLDRVYDVNGQKFSSSDEFGALINAAAHPVQLLVESAGRMRTVEVMPLAPLEFAASSD